MIGLLDANVLIALTVDDHVHHDVAAEWFASSPDRFATCPLTQGALVRHLLRAGASAVQAKDVVGSLTEHPRHTFWPDDLTFVDVDLRAVVGHRQVTDAYLVSLARTNRGRIITLDKGLFAIHPDTALLIGGLTHVRSR